MREDLADLRLHNRQDAMEFVAAVTRRTTSGSATMVFADRRGHVVEMFCVENGGDSLPELVALTCSATDPEEGRLLLITDRTGEVPVDRPDDELTWIELHATAAVGEVDLLDWFVTSSHYAFSVAEFAPIDAAW